MRALPAATALFLLAGCEAAVEQAGPAPTASAANGKIRYSDCSEQTALVAVPASLLPTLPEGFAYTTPAGDVGVAAVHISGARCQPEDGSAEAREVLAFALATVPPAYRDPDIATYAVALGGYSSRPESVAQFEAWGLTGLIRFAEVTLQLDETPVARVGSVDASDAEGALGTRMTASGPTTIGEPGGGHTRAVYIRDGHVLGVVEARYSEQTVVYAAGSVTQTGSGPIPLPLLPAVGSHAFDYSLEISSPRLP